MRACKAEWWDAVAEFFSVSGASVKGDLVSFNDSPVATGKDFTCNATLLSSGLAWIKEDEAGLMVEKLEGGSYKVENVTVTTSRSKPPAPFITSTLQMAGNRQLGLTAGETMRAAQALYEVGLISYMRTDNANMGAAGVEAAREEVKGRFGREMVGDGVGGRKRNKNKENAQENKENSLFRGSGIWGTCDCILTILNKACLCFHVFLK